MTQKRVKALKLPRHTVMARFPTPPDESVADEERIAAFWSWFQKGPAKWKRPGEDFDEEKLVELHEKLAEHFPELQTPIEWAPGEKFTLEFSAALTPGAAPLIRQTVRSAPRAAAWNFRAFRAPISFYDLYVGQFGLPYSSLPVSRCRVEVVSDSAPWRLRVYLPKFTARKREAFDKAVRLAIIAGMGEAWAHEQMGSLELAALEDAPKRAPPLNDLPQLTSSKQRAASSRRARRASAPANRRKR